MQLSRIKLGQLFQMLAIEDFGTVFNYTVQRLTTPLFNVHYIFEIDLTRAHELATPGRPLPPGFTIRILRGENEIGPIANNLGRAGIASAVLAERTKRGDLIAVALHQKDEVAAYNWATFTDAWMKEVRATLLLDRNEAFGFDTFVLPRWRGKGLQYALEARKFRHLCEHGYTRSLASVHALNTRSLRTQASEGKRKVATIFSVPMVGVAVVRQCFPDVVVRVERGPWWRGDVLRPPC